jgi:tetratricopeptide (TPR) repeat protein
MKRWCALLILLWSPSVWALDWDSGAWDEAVARAAAAGRWLVLDVYATWCGPCHEMDEKVYARDEVARALGANFVALRRDGEAGEGAELARRYHVVGYPTVLVIDPKGRAPDGKPGAEVDRLMGFVTPRDFVDTLAKFRDGRGTLAELERKLLAASGDEALRLEVGTRHAMRGDARALAELDAVVKADADNHGKRAAAALLTLGKYYWLRGEKNYARAEAALLELARRFPSSEEATQVAYNLGLVYHSTGRDREARAVLDGWIAAAPKDGSRYNAYAWLCYKNNFDRARGIEVARLGLQNDPKDHALWDTLGELLAATGQAAEARDAEQKALAIKPKDNYYEAQLRRFGGNP